MTFTVKDLHKSYDKGSASVSVLKGLSFSCSESEFVGIFGASGTGKSTLLHVIGGLDRPDSGSVLFDNEDIYKKRDKDLAGFRNRTVGFVFQFYHLLPEFSALENVMLPCLISGMGKGEATRLAKESLSIVELDHRISHRPSEMSGGEQQRVAIARAVVMQPKFILADEPTGNLDEATGNKVFAYLERLHKETKTGVIMVTHNPDLLKHIPKKYELKSGALV